MSLPVIRADWAQHMIYGAWAGATAQVVGALASVATGDPSGMALVPALGPMGAFVAGLAKEGSDWLSNLRARREWAAAAGKWGASIAGLQPYRHEVSFSDVVATVLGGCPGGIVAGVVLWGAS